MAKKAVEHARVEPRLKDFLKAGYPCVFLPTIEPLVAEARVVEALRLLGMERVKYGVWKITTGLKVGFADSRAEEMAVQAQDLVDALAFVETSTEPVVVVFHNMRQFVANHAVIQQMQDTILTARLRGSHVILVGPYIELPMELRNLVTWCECPLPDRNAILEEFEKVTKAYEEEIDLPADKKERERVLLDAANAAIGLDMMGAENALALSMSSTKTVDVRIIQAQKEQEVRKSDVLEFIAAAETMDNVGGFKAFKDWMRRRQRVFSDEAREYGLPYPRGVLIVGPAGCLSGATVLPFRRAATGGGVLHTVREAFFKFHQIPAKEFGDVRYLWPSDIPTQTLSLKDDGIVGYNDIIDIVYSGVKATYTVTAESGRSICVSGEHPFKVPDGTANADADGFKKLVNLSVGDEVLLRDWSVPDKVERKKDPRRIAYSIPYHLYAMDHWIDGRNYKRLPMARLVIEARLNEISTDKMVEICRYLPESAKKLRYLPPGVSIHHKDEDKTNDSWENLEVFMDEAAHQRAHGPAIVARVPYRRVTPEQIISIRACGEEETYDIIMREPYHNYLAEDFVVHNTGKSLVSKGIADFLKLPLLRLDMGKVFRSLVGESEGAIRRALKVVEAVSPVVLWVDELDKGLAGMKGSGELDSGVTSRVVSTILTWRQETQYPVMLAATANDVAAIPAMVYRKGRLDEVWATDLPTKSEREEIFQIHLRKRGRNPELFGCKLLAKRTEDFVGAEIEGVIEDAMFSAFDEGKEVTGQYIVKAVSETVPQARRNREEITAIRKWVETRARLVSEGEKHVKDAGGAVRKISMKERGKK